MYRAPSKSICFSTHSQIFYFYLFSFRLSVFGNIVFAAIQWIISGQVPTFKVGELNDGDVCTGRSRLIVNISFEIQFPWHQ